MLTQDELEREHYEARLKLQRDMASTVSSAVAEARKEWQIEQVHGYQRVLGQPQSPNAQLRGLSAAELERLVKQLEDEVARALRERG